MATAISNKPVSIEPVGTRASQVAFGVAVFATACAACLLAGWFPLGVSIVTVFLFAGPHNWAEARYMMARMPPRWGPLRPFFITAIFGVVLLTAGFAGLPGLAQRGNWNQEGWLTAAATWNTALVVWILLLVQFRSRQNPRREWGWTIPLGMTFISFTWLWPQAWDLGLVYLHPLMALWFLDRELARRKPAWQPVYRGFLAALPILLAMLWLRLANSASLPGDDVLSSRIVVHAGADVLRGVSSHLLVATHVFLEMIHYGVWLVLIPLITWEEVPWRLKSVPLARRSRAWQNALTMALVCGAVAVVLIWAGFLTDYPLTRDIYFTVAMFHVLAEVPFLLRLL